MVKTGLDTDGAASGDEPDPADTAAYIGAVTQEMIELARGSQLDIMVYLLEMARWEAMETVRRLGPVSPDRTI